jgi:hypothetical protein
MPCCCCCTRVSLSLRCLVVAASLLFVCLFTLEFSSHSLVQRAYGQTLASHPHATSSLMCVCAFVSPSLSLHLSLSLSRSRSLSRSLSLALSLSLSRSLALSLSLASLSLVSLSCPSLSGCACQEQYPLAPGRNLIKFLRMIAREIAMPNANPHAWMCDEVPEGSKILKNFPELRCFRDVCFYWYTDFHVARSDYCSSQTVDFHLLLLCL